MTENVGQFALVEPFDIDDGSLKGITPEKAFSLGVEWQLFKQRLDSHKAFTTFCLPENAIRIVKMVERHKRLVEDRPNAEQGWTQIYVGDCFA
jgi:hypothetical protein